MGEEDINTEEILHNYIDKLEKENIKLKKENKQYKKIIKNTINYIKLEKVIKEGHTLEQITNYEKNILELLGAKDE